MTMAGGRRCAKGGRRAEHAISWPEDCAVRDSQGRLHLHHRPLPTPHTTLLGLLCRGVVVQRTGAVGRGGAPLKNRPF
jgi:hypothetical protein